MPTTTAVTPRRGASERDAPARWTAAMVLWLGFIGLPLVAVHERQSEAERTDETALVTVVGDIESGDEQVVLVPSNAPVPRPDEPHQSGIASFYADSLAGEATASGEPHDPTEMVAAHRSLPFGTVLEVENLHNGKTVRVRVNDRGPFTRGRVVDLSKAAARKLGILRSGTAPVEVRVVDE